ncbi:MAG: hypothetical protein U5L09_19350 [Bacteroidales bacterium]|nr:hypothetical protein [Bacteroidales bacterium]
MRTPEALSKGRESPYQRLLKNETALSSRIPPIPPVCAMWASCCNHICEAMQEEAWFQGSTGSGDIVTFEQVPANSIKSNSYTVFVYYDENNYAYPPNSYYIYRD